MSEGHLEPTGRLSLWKNDIPVDIPVLVAPRRPSAPSLRQIIEHGLPQSGLPEYVNRWRRSNMPNLWRGFRRVMAARNLDIPTFYGALWLVHHTPEGDFDLGLASLRVVTTAGVNFIVDAFQNTTELENMKFHGIGTGTGAEATSDTALGTELTTEYATDNTRPTGSLGEGATANVFRTSATITPDSGGTLAITEHGIFSQAATGGGTLLDRSKFAAVNLVTGNPDSLTAQYDFTVTAGG